MSKLQINVNNHKPNDIIKFMRQSTNLTQDEFAKAIGKSKAWQQSNELGRSNYYFKDLLKIAKTFNFDIIIKRKD